MLVAVVGVLVLIGLAAWVGFVEPHTRDAAWRSIASERHALGMRERRVAEREQAADDRDAYLDRRERRHRDERSD